MKILIVDDEQSLLEGLKINLTAFGHKVVSANNGNNALELLKFSIRHREAIDLIVTDLKMPKMDGLELLRSARSIVPGLPVIIMSAYCDDSVQRELRLLDACRYIEKPFNPEKIRQTISRVFAELNVPLRSNIKEAHYGFNRDQIQ